MNKQQAKELKRNILDQFVVVSVTIDEVETSDLCRELFGQEFEVIVTVPWGCPFSPLTVAKWAAYKLTNGRDWIDAIKFEHADIFNVRDQVYVSWKKERP